MNDDQLKGKWKQLHGKVKSQWGKLTEDDVTDIKGDFKNFVGKVQERYGVAKEKAEEQVRSFLDKLDKDEE